MDNSADPPISRKNCTGLHNVVFLEETTVLPLSKAVENIKIDLILAEIQRFQFYSKVYTSALEFK